MEKMRKTVFITGTVSKTTIEEIVKLLDFIGYDALYSDEVDINDEVRSDRLRLLLQSDGLLCYGNNIGKNIDVYQQEMKTAKYLEKPIIFHETSPSNLSDVTETLESLVTKKVLVDIMAKEEVETKE